MHTLKVLSALLCYPEQEMFQHQQEMVQIVNQEVILEPSVRDQLIVFINTLTEQDLMDSQVEYVETFDRGRALSLLLFEHIHGESRDRGQAMVDLVQLYNQNGFDVTADELPDYIPLFLEFLSQQPQGEAIKLLSDVEHILALLATRLEQREHAYQIIFHALLSLVDKSVDLEKLRLSVAAEKRDDTAEALDKVWEEEAVRFTGADPTAGCGSNDKQEQRIPVDSIRRSPRQ